MNPLQEIEFFRPNDIIAGLMTLQVLPAMTVKVGEKRTVPDYA
jgi:hypothetical protein